MSVYLYYSIESCSKKKTPHGSMVMFPQFLQSSQTAKCDSNTSIFWSCWISSKIINERRNKNCSLNKWNHHHNLLCNISLIQFLWFRFIHSFPQFQFYFDVPIEIWVNVLDGNDPPQFRDLPTEFQLNEVSVISKVSWTKLAQIYLPLCYSQIFIDY